MTLSLISQAANKKWQTVSQDCLMALAALRCDWTKPVAQNDATEAGKIFPTPHDAIYRTLGNIYGCSVDRVEQGVVNT